MSSTIVSLIRTWTPVAAGALVAWLVTLGINLDADTEAGLITALTGVLIAAYYGLARALESRWPWVGYLLGVPVQPEYDQRTESERIADEDADESRRSIVAALTYDPRVEARPDPQVHRWHEG